MPLVLLSLALNPALAHGPAPVFVAPGAFNAFDMLPFPPAPDSATETAELAELHRIENERTESDIARARADEAERDIFIFKSVLGDQFNAEALPLTAALSAEVDDDEMADAEPIKLRFQRVRPYNVDESLHPVCKTKLTADSYPSGHATTGYLMALVLASMLPEKRDAIFARADDYVHNRLVCGVHFPSDVEAGKKIAYALFGAISINPQFKAERAAAEAEIRKVLALPARVNDSGHAE